MSGIWFWLGFNNREPPVDEVLSVVEVLCLAPKTPWSADCTVLGLVEVFVVVAVVFAVVVVGVVGCTGAGRVLRTVAAFLRAAAAAAALAAL